MHKFQIGEVVFVPIKIKEISIKSEGVKYKAEIKTTSGTCTDWFREEDLAGDYILGTITTGEVYVHNAKT